MGCATSHSEDLHKTSLLESDKFVTSLQEVPGYFNRTIHTADFLPPKFPDAEPEKMEMSYTGPPSHLRNSVDFHPYWHLMQQDYIPSNTIQEGEEEIPASLVPHTDTAQELRDIEVREAITDLRARVKETISSKLRENEEEFFAALSAHVDNCDRPYMEGRPPPPPLPEEDYMDHEDETDVARMDVTRLDKGVTDSPSSHLAQEEKETIDFLDSVINESLAWEEEQGEQETLVLKNGNSNWSFASSPSTSERDMNHHDYQQNKPLPGVNLDIASNKSSPVNSPMSFSKSIYLPEDKNTFISNDVIARQMDARSGVQIRSIDNTKQSTSPQRGAKDSPKRKSVPPAPPIRTTSIVTRNSADVIPPPPLETPPPPPQFATPPPPPPVEPPPPPPEAPPPPPPVNPPQSSPSEPAVVSPRRTFSRNNSSMSTKAEVHAEHITTPTEITPPPPPVASKRSTPPPALPRQLQSTKSLDRRDSKKAPVPVPTSNKTVETSEEKTNSLDRRDQSVTTASSPSSRVDTSFLSKTKSLDRRNSSPKSTPPPAAPRPKHYPPEVKPKPVRHSMIELPSETTIVEDLPSDDSGIKEEMSERSIHDIIKNLKLEDSSTLERKSKALPPPTSKKPVRPVSMPPTAMGPPVVKPKPQRKPVNNGLIPNGRGVGRTASFGATRRSMSDDASSEDSGLHMKEDADILSQIHVGIPEGQVR